MIKLIEQKEGRFIELYAEGDITYEDLVEAWPKIDDKIEEWGNVKVLKSYKTFPHIGWRAFWYNFSRGISKYKNFGSTAIVCDLGWVRVFSQVFAKIFRKNVKFFKLAELNEARSWLAAQSV